MNSIEAIEAIKINIEIKDFVEKLSRIKDKEILKFTLDNLQKEIQELKKEENILYNTRGLDSKIVEIPRSFTERNISPNKTNDIKLDEIVDNPTKQIPIEAVTKKSMHVFPDHLYHSSGAILEEMAGNLLYKPNYILKENQNIYGIPGEWNVVVTFKDGKYTTEHPSDYLNNQILTEKA